MKSGEEIMYFGFWIVDFEFRMNIEDVYNESITTPMELNSNSPGRSPGLV